MWDEADTVLDRSYSLAIYPDQIVTFTPILREMEELQDELIAATVQLSFQQDEIVSMKTQLNQLLLERDSFVNTGKALEHVSVRQQQRKLTDFRDSAEAALRFAESFGLIPKVLRVRTVHSEDQITIPDCSSDNTTTNTSVREAITALQTLYLLDRVGVSDEFYHELTQVCVHVYI